MTLSRVKMAVFLIIIATYTVIAANFRIGPKVGLSLGNLYGSVIEEEEDDFIQIDGTILPRLAITGGIEWGITFNKIFTFQSEVLYLGKGEKLKYRDKISGDTYTYSETYQYEYVGVPVFVRVTLPMETAVRLYFIAGPSFDFLIASQIKIKESQTGEETEIDYEDFERYSKTFEFSLISGLGIECKIGPGFVDVNARYSLGLSNTFDSPTNREDDIIKTSYLGFLIGYIFEL